MSTIKVSNKNFKASREYENSFVRSSVEMKGSMDDTVKWIACAPFSLSEHTSLFK